MSETMNYQHLMARVTDHIVTACEDGGLGARSEAQIALCRENVDMLATATGLDVAWQAGLFDCLDDEEIVATVFQGLSHALDIGLSTGLIVAEDVA